MTAKAGAETTRMAAAATALSLKFFITDTPLIKVDELHVISDTNVRDTRPTSALTDV
jgi:hypothetical protein